jgi:hypothetical protein
MAKANYHRTCILVSVNDALFDFGTNGQSTEVSGLTQLPIRDDQVLAIREAFASAGIESQNERQQIVQSTSIRPVSSLRELHAHEAHRVLQRIQQRINAKPSPEGSSAWDLREEDTWIDKL